VVDPPPLTTYAAAMQIELLHSPGCGGVDQAEETVRLVVAEQGIEAQVIVRNVVEQPDHIPRFAGSPTVLIDGVDVVPWIHPRLGAG
jgi:hypothetical protein